MLTESLQAVKDLVFEEENQIKTDYEIQKELDDISGITEVQVGSLTAFYNHFINLKMDMDRRGISTTKNLDWTDDQVAIMMLFMEERKLEKMGVEDAFTNLSNVLDKSKSGVQYKYYETKKSLKTPKQAKKKETRGRKPKNKSSLTALSGGKTEEKEIPKQVEKTSYTQSTEETVSKPIYKDYSKENEALFSRTQEQPVYNTDIVPVVNKQQHANNTNEEEEVDVADLITGMIQDFGQIEKTRASGTSTYKTILDLFKGLKALSALAAENSNKAQQNEQLQTETTLLRQKVDELNNENLELMKNYNEVATTLQEFNELDQVQRLSQWKNYMQTVSTQISQAGGVPEPNTNKKFVLDKNLNLLSR